jgi:tetratricopeptide (TPR) repeat protein
VRIIRACLTYDGWIGVMYGVYMLVMGYFKMTDKKVYIIVFLIAICSSFAFGQVTKEQLFDNGLKVYKKGYYITAIEYFDRVIEMDSAYAMAYYYKGLSYKKGTFADIHPDVVSNFKKAIQLDTLQNFWEAYFYLAYLAQFIDTSYYKLYDKAIEFNPNNSDIYYHRGNYYYWKKMDYKKGVADYEKALQLDDKNVNALSGLGFYYYTQLKDLNKALDYINRAIKLKPNDTGLLFNRAQILCKSSKLKKDLNKLPELSEYIYTKDSDCNIKLKKKNNP